MTDKTRELLDDIHTTKKFIITVGHITTLKNTPNITEQQLDVVEKLHTGYLKKHEKNTLLKMFNEMNAIEILHKPIIDNDVEKCWIITYQNTTNFLTNIRWIM